MTKKIRTGLLIALLLTASAVFSAFNPNAESASAAACTTAQLKDTVTYAFSDSSHILEKHTGKKTVGTGARGTTQTCEPIANVTYTKYQGNKFRHHLGTGSVRGSTIECYSTISITGRSGTNYTGTLEKGNFSGTTCSHNSPKNITINAVAVASEEIPTDPAAGTGESECSGEACEETTSCAVDGIGWILCPVMQFIAKLNDAAFNFLTGFLVVPTVGDSESDNPQAWIDGTKLAWDTFRNFANIAFVIAFMIIIYSQITGAGINNYGIKRLLPKLVVAAILVNISFYLCVAAVEVSNVVGSSLVSLFNDVTQQIVSKQVVLDPSTPDATPGGWDAAVSALLQGGAILGLVILIFLAPSVLLVFGVIIFILIARQAAIILLVAISPLAFVAYLLPNTEQWFQKWSKIFVSLLMVFPIIAAVFGASTLASAIIGNVAVDDGQMLAIMALGIQAVPLFAVPVLLKGSLSALGSIGQKLSGYADRSTGYAKKRAMEGRIGEAKNAFDRRSDLRKVNRRRGDSFLAQQAKARFGEDSLAHKATTLQSRFDRSGAGRYLGGDRGAAAAVAQYDKAFQEDVSAASVLQKTMDYDDRLAMATTGELKGKKISEANRVAAISYIMENGNFPHRQEVLQSVGGMEKRELQAASDGYYKAGMQAVFGAQFGGEIAEGKVIGSASDLADRLKTEAINNVAAGKLKGETIGSDADIAAYVASALETGGPLSPQIIQNAKDAAIAARNAPSLKGQLTAKVEENFKRIDSL